MPQHVSYPNILQNLSTHFVITEMIVAENKKKVIGPSNLFQKQFSEKMSVKFQWQYCLIKQVLHCDDVIIKYYMNLIATKV